MRLTVITFFAFLCLALLTGDVDAECQTKTTSTGLIYYISGGPAYKCNVKKDCCSKVCDVPQQNKNKPSKSINNS